MYVCLQSQADKKPRNCSQDSLSLAHFLLLARYLQQQGFDCFCFDVVEYQRTHYLFDGEGVLGVEQCLILEAQSRQERSFEEAGNSDLD